MAKSELALKVEISKLKKMIAMLRLGGAGTQKEVEQYTKDMRALEAELAKAAKK